jgi:hypothetical protein
MSRKVKSVSFNLDDKFELEMYEYSIKVPNFSSFVKRLIQNYLNGEPVPSKPKQVVSTPSIEQPSINQDYMRQLI